MKLHNDTEWKMVVKLENLFGNEMNSTHKSESKAVRPIR